MLKRRLRIKIFNCSINCSLCDQIMDCYADHALVCSAGGDRNNRHNYIRNKVYGLCEAAKLRPELEKQYIIPNSNIRPADIYVPNLQCGQQTALDFAITSGLKNDVVVHSTKNNKFATEEYSNLKWNLNNIGKLCQNNDIKYIPMIVEASTGSWNIEGENI